MRALLWPVSLFALALWSLLCWGASGLVSMTALGRPAEAGLLAAPLSAETWLAQLGLIGQGTVVFFWAAGTLLILLVTLALSGLIGSAKRLLRDRRTVSKFWARRTPRDASARLAARIGPRLLRRFLR